MDPQLLRKLRLLKLDAEALPQGESVAAPAIAEHLDLPAVGAPQAFEDLDGRGLAGAVRAEHPEAFAAADFEVEAGDRDGLAVALDQAAASQRGGGRVRVMSLKAV